MLVFEGPDGVAGVVSRDADLGYGSGRQSWVGRGADSVERTD